MVGEVLVFTLAPNSFQECLRVPLAVQRTHHCYQASSPDPKVSFARLRPTSDPVGSSRVVMGTPAT